MPVLGVYEDWRRDILDMFEINNDRWKKPQNRHLSTEKFTQNKELLSIQPSVVDEERGERKHGLQLRPYQKTCVKLVLEEYKKCPAGGKALLDLAVGGGKTIIFAGRLIPGPSSGRLEQVALNG